MNVSANFLLVPAFHTPVWVGRTFSQQILLLAFDFAKVFGLWLILPIAPFGVGLRVFNGEFDPGSGRTLAACLTHASRAVRPFGVHERRTGE